MPVKILIWTGQMVTKFGLPRNLFRVPTSPLLLLPTPFLTHNFQKLWDLRFDAVGYLSPSHNLVCSSLCFACFLKSFWGYHSNYYKKLNLFLSFWNKDLIFYSLGSESRWIRRQLKLRGTRWSLRFECPTSWKLVSIDIPCPF